MGRLFSVILLLSTTSSALFETARGQANPPVNPAPADGEAERLRQTYQSKLALPIILTDGTRTVTRKRRELAIGLDEERMLRAVRAKQQFVPVVLTVDKAAMKNALGRIAKEFYQPPIDAKPYVYRGQLRIDPGSHKRALNVPTTSERLAQLVAQNPAARTFTVTLDKTPPTLTANKLKGINGRLANYETVAANNASRNRNVRIGVEAINGTLLSPGEVFSVNAAVGKRTKTRGFKEALVFVDAEKVRGVGGGVSQVTGTLFNAAALAGLKINEVNPHSRPVAYIPVGRDATVAWGAKDLKFTNNTGAPVYLAYTFDNQRLRATLFGKKNGKAVTLTPRIQRFGPGHITAQLFRTIRENGRVVQKERLLGHTYRWEPES